MRHNPPPHSTKQHHRYGHKYQPLPDGIRQIILPLVILLISARIFDIVILGNLNLFKMLLIHLITKIELVIELILPLIVLATYILLPEELPIPQ